MSDLLSWIPMMMQEDAEAERIVEAAHAARRASFRPTAPDSN